MELLRVLNEEDIVSVKEQARASKAKRTALLKQRERLLARLDTIPAMREQAIRQERECEELIEQTGTGFPCLTLEAVDNLEALWRDNLNSVERLLQPERSN